MYLGSWNTAFWGRGLVVSLVAVLCACRWGSEVRAAESPAPEASSGTPSSPPSPSGPAKKAERRIEILEYEIEGGELLPQIDVEAAVYPFLGPDRSAEDVEAARASLEAAYSAKGFQTVAVEIPPQQVKDGVVLLKVTEGKVGRLRVKGSRYFDINDIKAQAPSLAEGTVPNLEAVSRDIVALNQIPDRRVTPALRAGRRPGTVDVDLNVDDSFPLHGSLEVNNRYSKDTTKLRMNGSVRYDNLWQMGHSLNIGYQVAPRRAKDGEVYSGSYLARLPSTPWLSFLAYGVKQNSDVSTMGTMNVVGKGTILGGRALMTLPGDGEFFHSISVGIERKRFQEKVLLADGDGYTTPVGYWPLNAAYAASWMGAEATTQLNLSATTNFRAMGSGWEDFDNKRYAATASFTILRADLARTQELPHDLQAYAKVQGQISPDVLISSEQFSAGGLDTVRGYMESETVGDIGVVGSVELRSPSLTEVLGKDILDEWRFHAFLDGGRLKVREALSEQKSAFTLWSYGVGTRIKLLDYLNGSFDVGVPMIAQGSSRRGSPFAHFRVWGEF